MKKKIYFKQFLKENGMQNENGSYNFTAIRDVREADTGNTVLHLIAENKFVSEHLTNSLDYHNIRKFISAISCYNKDILNILNNNCLTAVELLLLGDAYKPKYHLPLGKGAILYTFVNFGACFKLHPYSSHVFETIKTKVVKAHAIYKNAIAQGMLNFVLGEQGQFNGFFHCIRTNKALCNSLYDVLFDITTEYTKRTILQNVSEFCHLYNNKNISVKFTKMDEVVNFFAGLTFSHKETIVYMLAKFVPQNKAQAELMQKITNCAVNTHKINVNCITTIKIDELNIDQYVVRDLCHVPKFSFAIYLRPIFLACVNNNVIMLNLLLQHQVDLVELQDASSVEAILNLWGNNSVMRSMLEIMVVVNCIETMKVLLEETNVIQHIKKCGYKDSIKDLSFNIGEDTKMSKLLITEFDKSKKCVMM